ncbi:hypothetical protein [Dactylosporangium sp. CA-092794]|uniref:hypothetical protein n=1 Tax=Dactylosporangium sp. CA-092794 TaxID=3239929 RepID=UPI003D8F72E2
MATEAVVWSVTAEDPIADDVVGVLTELVGVAARMVRLTDGADVLDDLVITSPAWFHVLRTAGAQGDDTHVVHLLLDRRSANLALARLELRTLVDAAASAPEPVRALPAAPQQPGLPHRSSRKATATRPARSATAAVPAWLAQFAGETFEMDEEILDRVLAGLRRLV